MTSPSYAERQQAGIRHLLAISREQRPGLLAADGSYLAEDEEAPRYPETKPLPCPVADQIARLDEDKAGYRTAGRHRK